MAQEKQEIRQFVSEDGSRGEKRITETENQKTVEIYLEPRQLNLQKRITEEKRPVVCHRETETFDVNGAVVEKVVEDIDNSELQKISHVVMDYAPQRSCCCTGELKSELPELLKARLRQVKALEAEPTPTPTPTEPETKNSNTLNVIFLAAFVVEALVLGWVVFLMQ